VWVLRDQIPDNNSKEEWKSSPFTSEISGEKKELFTYFLKVGRDALLRCEGLPTGISFFP